MATEQQQPDLSFLTQIPDRDLEDIFAAIRAGAEQPGDALGFGPEALNAVEQMALSFYRTRMVDKAAVLYGFVLQMNVRRGTAWRGLGACTHSLQRYDLAVECYRRALERDGEDVISKVFLGECLCHLGNKDEGLKLLNEVVAKKTKNPAYLPYVTRARAVIGADGGIPTRLVLRKQGQALAKDAEEAIAAEQAPLPGSGPGLDGNREITLEDMKKNPELAKVIGELSKAVEEGRLTYAEVGGFTADELDGAYACACKYAEMGQVLEAIQIAGYLIFLDPYMARAYQLVGICMQRLKQYENADYYYRVAQKLAPEDAMTLVYRGETKIMTGKTDEGMELVKKGVAIAKGKPQWKEVAERGQVLVRQFGGG
jgi:tetratricopeptide (TPR) repeat protein